MSYSLGYDTGSRMKMYSVDLDPEVFMKAFKEGFAGKKAAMTDQEMRDAVQPLKQELQAKQAEETSKLTASNKGLAEKNKQEGDAFLAENAKKEGVVTLPSGLQYKVLKAGDGKKPTEADTVECKYRGTLIDGTDLDSSEAGKPAVFKLTGVIPGWREALQLMPEGSKWRLFIPPELGYGKQAADDRIGPSATLVFEVELINVRNSEKEMPSQSKP